MSMKTGNYQQQEEQRNWFQKWKHFFWFRLLPFACVVTFCDVLFVDGDTLTNALFSIPLIALLLFILLMLIPTMFLNLIYKYIVMPFKHFF